MVKFLKRQPAECCICHQVKDVYKHEAKGNLAFDYCKDCYDAVYKRTEAQVKAQIKEMVEKGQKIGMKEALDLTKKISAQIEAEYANGLKQ